MFADGKLNDGSTSDNTKKSSRRPGNLKLGQSRDDKLSRVTLQSSVKDKIFATPCEVSKVENVTAEMIRVLDQLMERKEDEVGTRILQDGEESLRDVIGYEYGLSSSKGWTKLIGLELVQETTDKVVLIKEKLKAARDRQKSYADNRRKLLEFEVADQVLLKVSPWKGVVDKTLRFVEEPVEIIDREVKSLKRSRIPIVKVHWNLKRGHEDFIKSKYPHLLVEQAIVRSTK
ncbi:hypothetical protein Tco_1029673 [Tanacetum coccineum]|uniref:Reverse transcriptase domain-containing protein n=1 Tax=Tanacetum coccineum TaxID=301880 RepID=A0ABQ5G6C8_9ASTR